MQTFLLALTLMLIVVAIMAIGVLLGRKPIAGSCGGIPAALGEQEEDYTCPICGDDPTQCEEQTGSVSDNKISLFYAADVHTEANRESNKKDD